MLSERVQVYGKISTQTDTLAEDIYRDIVKGRLGDAAPLAKCPPNTRLIETAATPVGSCLALLRRAERGWLQKKMSGVRETLRRKWSRVVLAGAALLVAAMFLPLPYRVKCDCELQPVVRRYVAAPFDATLERSYVEPGDLVSKEQLLAQIDGREIRESASANLVKQAHTAEAGLQTGRFDDPSAEEVPQIPPVVGPRPDVLPVWAEMRRDRRHRLRCFNPHPLDR